jgi:hypothetical protein
MDNYDLLSITIENEFLKNAIRWPSQGISGNSHKCEAALRRLK